MRTSIVELRTAGITLDADEAVAIAQQLIRALRDQEDADETQPPFGPPSPDNVFLKDDGSVVCRGCTITPAVSEVGIFLDTLLPARSPRVPGRLRYTIARALLNVDVPPFDSLDDLSRDLARHQRGTPADLVRGVLARFDSAHAVATLSIADRRRHLSSSALRRALREADMRLYEHQHQRCVDVAEPSGVDADPTAVDADVDTDPIVGHAAPIVAPPRRRTMMAAAAGLAAGLALMGTGEFMDRRQAPIVVTQTAPLGPQVAEAHASRVTTERGTIAVRQIRSSPIRASRPEARRLSVRRTPRPSAVAVRRQAPSAPSRSVLDRLRLGWLRRVFTHHSDL